VLVQVLYGVQDVDPVARDTARSYRFSRWGRVRHVVWPTALPYVMTGLRLASAVALVLAVTSELIIGAPGLGQQIALAQSGAAVPDLYALVVVTGLVGIAINFLFRWAERRVLSWHPSVRGEVAAMSRVLRRLAATLALPSLLVASGGGVRGQHQLLPAALRQILAVFPQVWTVDRLETDVLPSLARLAAGYLLAAVAGIGLGVVIGRSRVVRGVAEPGLEFFRAIPPPVLVPS
jgi:ABC-type nitrate/sulfonate/bicarbonate transport system permease component